MRRARRARWHQRSAGAPRSGSPNGSPGKWWDAEPGLVTDAAAMGRPRGHPGHRAAAFAPSLFASHAAGHRDSGDLGLMARTFRILKPLRLVAPVQATFAPLGPADVRIALDTGRRKATPSLLRKMFCLNERFHDRVSRTNTIGVPRVHAVSCTHQRGGTQL